MCDEIRQASCAVHHYLRHGHLGKVDENGLAHRPRKAGVKIVQQHSMTVLGEYLANMLVEPILSVESRRQRLHSPRPKLEVFPCHAATTEFFPS